MVETTAVPAEPGPVSSWRQLINVLVAPREAFATLRAKPVFGLALSILMVTAGVAILVSFSRVSADDLLRSIEASGRVLPPQARENPERILSITRWSQGLSAPVIVGVMYVAVAGVFLLILRLLGSDIRFRQSLATTTHGLLPMAAAALLGTFIALGRERIAIDELQWGGIVASHLGILAGDSTGKIARALLTSVDLFSAWCVYLLATGFQIVGSLTRTKAWATVLAVWAAGIGLKVLFASFGPG